MGTFLEKYNLPKLNEEAAGSLNRLITAGEVREVIKKTSSTQKPWTGWLYGRIKKQTNKQTKKHLRRNTPNVVL